MSVAVRTREDNRDRAEGRLMTRVLILGYGNPLRGDDAAGWEAGRLLAELEAGDQVEVHAFHQLTPEWAEPLSRCSRAIFIDASVQDAPGQVRCRRITPPGTRGGAFTHDFTPETLLGMAAALYGSCPEAFLISIGAESFEPGADLSPAVAQGLPALLACVREQVFGLEGRPDRAP
jgi:hydrogenase maturation protease